MLRTSVSELQGLKDSRFWRFCVVTLLFGFFCGCRVFCHRTESDLFLFLFHCFLKLSVGVSAFVIGLSHISYFFLHIPGRTEFGTFLRRFTSDNCIFTVQRKCCIMEGHCSLLVLVYNFLLALASELIHKCSRKSLDF